ncbi:unnamed protein product, partial [Protopolystoma xenopodis]
AYVEHPDLSDLRSNREYALKSVCDAVTSIQTATSGLGEPSCTLLKPPGELIELLNNFENKALIGPEHYVDAQHRAALYDRLDDILALADRMIHSESCRAKRKQAIKTEITKVQRALDTLLNEYQSSAADAIIHYI